MRRLITRLPAVFLLFLGACGGGSGSSNSTYETPPEAPVGPTFTSPHPDIWETATPSESGFDDALLTEAFDYALSDGNFTQAALVIKGGKLVREQYRGITPTEAQIMADANPNAAAQVASFWTDIYGPEDSRDALSPVTTWSTAKSFTSLLIGIAIEQGHIDSTDQSASDFISEWAGDDRASITVQHLLDMRSGLTPMCTDLPNSLALIPCSTSAGASSGGNMVYSLNQLSGCINRDFIASGTTNLSSGVPYEEGQFYYSNCDTQVLGEIVYRATGQDPGLFAQQNVFEPLNISAEWWRDAEGGGQADGNYLTYCCIDATARDFAKFGYMLLLGGIETEDGLNYASYVSTILAQNDWYRNQFWAYCPNGSPASEACNQEEILISTVGFDGQFILVDQKNDLVVVRNSLYQPFLNDSDERKMRLSGPSVAEANWTGSLPRAMSGPGSSFWIIPFHQKIVAALVTEGVVN